MSLSQDKYVQNDLVENTGVDGRVLERVNQAISSIKTKNWSGDDWKAHLGRSKKQIDRYKQGADFPLSFLTKLSLETNKSLCWLITGHDFDFDRKEEADMPNNYENTGFDADLYNKAADEVDAALTELSKQKGGGVHLQKDRLELIMSAYVRLVKLREEGNIEIK